MVYEGVRHVSEEAGTDLPLLIAQLSAFSNLRTEFQRTENRVPTHVYFTPG